MLTTESKLNGFEIQHYRSIRHLQLTDLAKINLYIGKPNTGKTTLLEALWLITGMTNAANMPRIESISRNFTYINEDSFSVPFYERNVQLHPKFSTSIHGDRRTLEIKPLFDKTHLFKDADMPEIPQPMKEPTPSQNNGIEGLEFTFTENETISGQSSLILLPPKPNQSKNQSNMQVFMKHKHQDKYHCTFVYQNELNPNTLSEMFRNHTENLLLELLKKIDPSIQGITLIDNILYVECGFSKRMPINSFGDTLKKMVAVYLSFFVQKNNFLAIDELETYVSSSHNELLWEIIAKGAHNHNVDAFITLRHKHTLEGLLAFLKKKRHATYRPLFRLHHITRSAMDKLLTVRGYAYDELRAFLKA